MEKIPPEVLDNIVKQLSNDIASLKHLRLTARSFSDPVTPYLYHHLVLFNTNQSWQKYMAVVSHRKYRRLVKTTESSSVHDETCIFHHYDECDHDYCKSAEGYLNIYYPYTGLPSRTTLKLHGFRHFFGRKLEGITHASKIRKLELDMTLFVGNDEEAMWVTKPSNVKVPSWMSTLDGVRELSLTQRPTYHGRDSVPFFVNFLLPFIKSGWSGLEKLSLKHTAAPAGALEEFLRNQSETLISLRIVEPVITPEHWQILKAMLNEIAPHLRHIECTDSYAPQHPELDASEWYKKMVFVIFLTCP